MRTPKIILLWFLLFAVALVFSGCSSEKRERVKRALLLQESLAGKKALLEHTETKLAATKKKQSVWRNIFQDTPEVNALQADIAELKKDIKITQKELQDLQYGTSPGWKKSLGWGFVVSLVVVILLFVCGLCEPITVLVAFLILWLIFSAAIKSIFF